MKKNNVLITVIITSYNKKKFILKTIKSVKNQIYKNIEIIVIDNCSNDGSDRILSKISKIKLLKNKIYLSPALNQIRSIEMGVKKSKGSIICLLDGDDLFKKNKVKEIVNYFNKFPNSKAVFDIPIILDKAKIQNFNFSKNRINNSSIWPTTFPTSTISLKKKYLEKCIKVFKKRNYELLEIDFRLSCLFSIYKESYNVIGKRLTLYRQVDDGIMSNYQKFGKYWWIKRSQAFDFFILIKKKFNKKFFFSIDYFITKIISKFFKCI